MKHTRWRDRTLNRRTNTLYDPLPYKSEHFYQIATLSYGQIFGLFLGSVLDFQKPHPIKQISSYPQMDIYYTVPIVNYITSSLYEKLRARCPTYTSTCWTKEDDEAPINVYVSECIRFALTNRWPRLDPPWVATILSSDLTLLLNFWFFSSRSKSKYHIS